MRGQFHDALSLPLEGTPVARFELDTFREEKISCPAAIRGPVTPAYREWLHRLGGGAALDGNPLLLLTTFTLITILSQISGVHNFPPSFRIHSMLFVCSKRLFPMRGELISRLISCS
jgi:hypothetical protein